MWSYLAKTERGLLTTSEKYDSPNAALDAAEQHATSRGMQSQQVKCVELLNDQAKPQASTFTMLVGRAHILAMMALQSERYDADGEYRSRTDAVLAITQQFVSHIPTQE